MKSRLTRATTASNKKVTTLELVILSLMGAIFFVSQIALAFLPNIELVSVLVIACTRVFGKKTLYPIYVFAIAEGLLYGFGIWWICYLYVWSILCIITLFTRKSESVWVYAITSAFFGLFFGFLCSIPQVFIGGFSFAVSWWVSGIPFDLLHCAGNAVTAFLLVKPITNMLRYLVKHIEQI